MNVIRTGSIVLAAALTVGCGDDGRLPTHPVTGSVTVNGKPVPGVTVSFFPEAEENSRQAIGVTDEEGNFSLTTYSTGDGAVAGAYSVVIFKRELKEDVDTRAFTPTNDPNDTESAKAYGNMMMAIQRGYSPLKKKTEIPLKYTDRNTTDLKRTVEASGGNVFGFDL